MDKERFVQLVTDNTGLMYRAACTILHNGEDARDAIQETIMRAWEKRGTLRDESRFRPWLMRILTNTCRNIQRKRRRVVSFDDVPEPSCPPPDPALAMALQSLPESLRLPLVLVYSEGMSYEEAAMALDVSLPTVRSRIHRAKEQLRKELSEE